MVDKSIETSFIKLEEYCRSEAYKGYDPFDGLNSKLFDYLPFLRKSRLFKLIWIQFFKRSPVNFRKIAGIKKDYNAKAVGLFLSGYCNLYKINPTETTIFQIRSFIDQLQQCQSDEYSGSCWGYNFDWQARAFFQPKNTPTIVATTFISNALLDAYEIIGEEHLLKMARSSCDFIIKDLNKTYDDKGNFAFSYSPLDKSVVFNASLLGSRLLSRVYNFTKESILIEEAKKSVAFCCNQQLSNGSWCYGTHSFHQWIDNFHTGYNLECIAEYMKFSGDNSYEQHLDMGFTFYIKTFFTEEGIPKYYSNSIYPIDIHAPAQMVITLSKLDKFQEQKELLDRVLKWTITNMQSEKGYFYYQINKYFPSKIPYIRWAQAWMFYALSTYLFEENKKTNKLQKP
ncbi:delta-aminolevulinic acid dehydratase [Muriicola sp. Z0-33]|uniref:delta-aminolevulinic acid dehydratase n=1 Tax=Muriicola sp. Z0-33 TaxID=2816957 RepID=UPI002238466A|nr:delta-aminolevulinic acid dehydratase [Muriicola sp. Z0-33]MCW5517991.1 delta-aminolevulinic acid dehydratase [Muriicola sp. Z0-33]